MDSPLPPSAHQRGEDYEKLHSIALKRKPDFELEEATFAIAILSHDKDLTNCEPSDFVWLKVKAVRAYHLHFWQQKIREAL